MSIVDLVGLDVAHRQRPAGAQLTPFDGVDAPCASRRGEVMLDLRRLARELVRLHDQPLDERRNEAAEQQRPDDHAAHADHGPSQEPTLPRVPDEQHPGHQHQDREHAKQRESDIEVRVRRAEQHGMPREQERRHVDEKDPNGIHGEEHRAENREVHLRARRDVEAPGVSALSDDRSDVTACRVDRDGDDEERQPHQGVGERDEVLHHRNGEHVVRDVATEDGIDAAEGRAVEELREIAPRATGRQREHERHEEAGGERHPGRQPLHEHARTFGGPRIGIPDMKVPRRQATERDARVPVQDREAADPGDEREHPLRGDLRQEDALEADVPVPEPIRETCGDRWEKHQQSDDQEDGQAHGAPGSRPIGAADPEFSLHRRRRKRCHFPESGSAKRYSSSLPLTMPNFSRAIRSCTRGSTRTLFL